MGAAHVQIGASRASQGQTIPKSQPNGFSGGLPYDPAKGETKIEEHNIGGDGPVRTIKHKAKDQAEAKEQAKAEAARLNRGRGSGHFTQCGRLDVSAEVDIIASGFGPIENGKWRCRAVENTFDDGGFTTTMEVEAPETPKN